MATILFIEDEPALQRALTHVLTESGFQTLSATDGEAGLRIAKEQLPDLILLDLILPKKDGFAVIRNLKEDTATAHIPVIVLTNREGMADIERITASGAAAYLVKANYQLDEVVEKIKEVLKRPSPNSFS
ncbi:MAG: response regulator [Candidatus Sungbacteria bacterium]|nr:response regulator [Candidatus Sungbacteria bacterium]